MPSLLNPEGKTLETLHTVEVVQSSVGAAKRPFAHRKTRDVAAGIRCSATLRELPTNKRVGADDRADYLIAKRSMLHYDRYFAEGLPIATGVIEGCCRRIRGRPARIDISS